MPFVLTLPVLGVVLVLSFLAFVQGKTAVNDLMAQNLDQIHRQITKQLDEFLKVPSRINHINAHLISQKKLDISDIREWRHTFFEQLSAFDLLSSSKLDLLQIALKKGWIKLIRGKLPIEKYIKI